MVSSVRLPAWPHKRQYLQEREGGIHNYTAHKSHREREREREREGERANHFASLQQEREMSSL